MSFERERSRVLQTRFKTVLTDILSGQILFADPEAFCPGLSRKLVTDTYLGPMPPVGQQFVAYFSVLADEMEAQKKELEEFARRFRQSSSGSRNRDVRADEIQKRGEDLEDLNLKCGVVQGLVHEAIFNRFTVLTDPNARFGIREALVVVGCEPTEHWKALFGPGFPRALPTEMFERITRAIVAPGPVVCVPATERTSEEKVVGTITDPVLKNLQALRYDIQKEIGVITGAEMTEDDRQRWLDKQTHEDVRLIPARSRRLAEQGQLIHDLFARFIKDEFPELRDPDKKFAVRGDWELVLLPKEKKPSEASDTEEGGPRVRIAGHSFQIPAGLFEGLTEVFKQILQGAKKK